MEIVERQGTINGLSFTWLEAGEPDAPLAVCQHGFPDTPWGWRWVLPALAAAGYHAIAPYARGYAPTAVPDSGISAVSAWIADLIDFHEQLGGGVPGVVVGHDWGSMAAYGAAGFAPDRWSGVVIASVPPASVMASRLYDYEQVKAFWYQHVFRAADAEAIVNHDDMAFIDGLWHDWSPGFDASEELPRVKESLRGPTNLTAALGTYRSIFDLTLQPPEYAGHAFAMFSPLPGPALYLHGTDDTLIPSSLKPEFEAALPDGSRVELIEGAGHFLQYERPDEVAELIVDWVQR